MKEASARDIVISSSTTLLGTVISIVNLITILKEDVQTLKNFTLHFR